MSADYREPLTTVSVHGSGDGWGVSKQTARNSKLLEGYGVLLERLREDHLEMVRQWRTSPEISQYMVYREPITPSMQRQWFAALDPERDLHYVIFHEGIPCGLCDIKQIDWDAGTCVGGIFMVPEYWNSEVPLQATFCAFDFSFNVLGLKAALGKVLKTNTRAIRFNRFLGYRIVNSQDSDEMACEMRLDKKDYESATHRLREYLMRRSSE